MSAKTLDLRWLTDAERDIELRIAVAETDGWVRCGNPILWKKGNQYAGVEIRPDYSSLPDYARSADAVLPLLEKFKWRSEHAAPYYGVAIESSPTHWTIYKGDGTTFALAACYALLRANGYEILT